MLTRALLTLTALGAAASLAACGSSSDTATDTATNSGAPAAASPASPSAAGSSPAEAAAPMPTGNAAPKQVTCSYPADGQGSGGKEVAAPPTAPVAGGTVAAVIKTSSGDVPITLEAAKAPCTVNSFLSLATQGFFDDTPCHRLTTAGIYILQCGDPTGSGYGGPGYSFADETTAHETYPAATIAMANSGPDTNGSQFFLCYGDCSTLDPKPGAKASYTIFGKISPAGLKVLQAIADKGTTNGQQDGTPAAHPKITGITFP